MISAGVSASVLFFSAAFAVFLLAQLQSFRPEQRPPALAALVGFVLMAGASLMAGLRFGFDWPLKEAHLLLRNAAVYLGLPLIASAYASLCWPWNWSRPAWGRWALALMALFELVRRMGLGEYYQEGLGTLCLALIALMGLRHLRQRRTIASFAVIGAASLFAGGVVIGVDGRLAGFLRLDLFHYLSALGCLFLGSGLFLLLRRRNLETL